MSTLNERMLGITGPLTPEQEADLKKYCDHVRVPSQDTHNNLGALQTRGHITALAELAIDIALGCPLDRPNQPGYYTYVSRDTVREIRQILERAGIPWKQQHKELRRK